MPWVRFIEPFDWAPPEANGRWMKRFKPGRRFVNRACADAALAAGKAVPSSSPRRPEAESDAGG